ncbi:MAG: hypothetical protein ACOZBW_11095 [Thermodesulfobacteriota bacterium]
METNRLFTALARLCAGWEDRGLFPRNRLMITGRSLAAWKQRHAIAGLWPTAPTLATATLDDGLGMGLDLIELYAGVAGMRVERLGLLAEPEDLMAACERRRPDFLGLTVLRDDAMDLLDTRIAPAVPAGTTILAGGPVFRLLPSSERKEKPYVILPDLPAFVRFVLNLKPAGGA